MDMLISVIVPIYKVESYLNRCIDSIINQTYKNLEIILVDDGSPDRCGEICDNYAKLDSRIRVIHKINGGLSSARNAGLKIAKGDYIGFVDSDDYIKTDMYENLINACIMNECHVSGVRYERRYQNGLKEDSLTVITDNSLKSSEEYFRELLLHVGDVSVCTKLFEKSILENLFFDERKNNEDLLFMIGVIERVSSIYFIAKIGYYYMIREGSITNQGFSKTIVDMVDNSIDIYKFVLIKYPYLRNEGLRFVLFQHMIYMIRIPSGMMNRNNEHYIKTLRVIRNNIFEGLFNTYLKLLDKMILVTITISPTTFKSLIAIYKILKKNNRIKKI